MRISDWSSDVCSSDLDAVEARALDVQDLALQRQDRLNLAVAALFGRPACRVTLDKEKFAFGGVAFLTIGELAGQARDVHRALAPRQFARLFRCFARRGGVDALLDHRLGIRGIFLAPFGHPVDRKSVVWGKRLSVRGNLGG